MRLRLFALILIFLLAGCGWTANPLPVVPTSLPSPTPRVLSPTPVIILPTITTPTLTPSVTPTGIPPTETPSPTSPTPTLAPALEAVIFGCNTSLDLSHSMGEVTNAFATLRNPGGLDLTQVCATLSASDEDREHPDKTVCVPLLAAGYQVTLKLTVDTGFREDTSIQIDVVSAEGLSTSASAPSCTALSLFSMPPGDLGAPLEIP
ncbi:MAG: hypothetical protein JXB85_05405 [Anaerolineales bacterium]|nr:hypothetical protein [Anaerolineales bacterium]